MKKILYLVFFSVFVVGCKNKRESLKTVRSYDSLKFYFAKVDNLILPQKTRTTFNDKALKFLLSQKEDSLCLENLFKVANNFYDMNDLESYKNTTQIILKKSYKLNNKPNIAKSESYLGDYYKIKSVLDSAYLCYAKAEKVYNELKDKKNLGEIHLNKAFLFYNKGDYSRAHASAFEALTYLFDSKNDNNLYRVYVLIGVIFDDSKEYENALDYYTRALNYFKNNTIKKEAAFSAILLNNLGLTYQKLDKNKEAIAYFEKGLQQKDLYKKRPHLYAMLQDNLAYSYFKLKQYSELPDLFYKALAIRDSLQIITGIVINKLHLSDYYQDKKDNTKALQFAKEAYTTAKEKGIDPKDILISLKRLETLDSSKYSFYATEYSSISDSLRRTVPALPDKMIFAAYDAKDLALQKAQLELREEKLKESNQKAFISFLIFVIIAVLLCWLFYRSSKKKDLLIKEQKQKNKEESQRANESIYTIMLYYSDALKEKSERNISDKLHNFILDKLTGIRYRLEDVLSGRFDDDGSHCIDELKKIETYIVEISKSVKENQNSFAVLIEDLTKGYNFENLHLRIPNYRWQYVSATIKVTLFNVIKEVFNNIASHSKASEIYTIISITEDDVLELLITDDGIGFNTDGIKERSGLKKVRLAVDEINGLFSINSKKSIGTKVKLTVKLKDNINKNG